MNDPVFVFGSNLAGRHGKGAALWARQHRGAVYGQGIGLQGNSCARFRSSASRRTSASSSRSRARDPISPSS